MPDPPGDDPGEPPVEPLAADPIAFVAHGAMFDEHGQQLQATAELMKGVQELYLRALLHQATDEQRAAFELKRREVLGAGAWDERSKLYASAALIDWLIQEVKPDDAARFTGHNKLLQQALTRPDFGGNAAVTPLEVPSALRDLLVQEGLERPEVGGLDTTLYTSAGGAAYINECAAAGVPIPPTWGSSQWVSRGVLTNEFIGESSDTEVFTYQSSSPAGMCVALPRSSGDTIYLLGIICLGQTSSNACFWDNQQLGSSFPIPKGTTVPLSGFFGGADLQKNVGGQCTDCHAGENPYIIHPGTVLGLPNLSGMPLRANNWYRPLVPNDWLQNSGPTNVLDSVPSTGRCTSCHTQTYAGRFPQLSTAYPGYCNTILPMAFSRTMPPGAVGSADYLPHYNALQAECRRPTYGFGFARVSAAGAVGTSYSSTGGVVTASRTVGNYTVTFAGLGGPVGADSAGGHIQVSAEGAGNVRCRSMGWSGSPDLSASVQCNAPDGSLADSAFTVMFNRAPMPAPNPWPTMFAFTWVTAPGGVHPYWDYNSSGTHNTVTKSSTGQYTVHITNATAVNASMMITSYAGGAGAVCSISSWAAGIAWVECRDRLGNLADTAFNLSYSVSGPPTTNQQGGHAWFDGTAANSYYSAALGKLSCSTASVTGSRSGSLASVVVAGELGSWTASPFRRASLASKYGTAGYCKVESQSSVEGAWSTATSTVRCYSATGAPIAVPQFTLTHLTSDGSGPC